MPQLSHHDIKHHHQDKANRKTDGIKIAVLTAGGLWYQFLNHDIEHGTRSKGQHIRENRNQRRGQLHAKSEKLIDVN